MSYPTLYFGVELEFALGWVDPYTQQNDPLKRSLDELDPRATQFVPDPDKEDEIRETCAAGNRILPQHIYSTAEGKDYMEYVFIREAIRKELRAIKLPVRADSEIGSPTGSRTSVSSTASKGKGTEWSVDSKSGGDDLKKWVVKDDTSIEQPNGQDKRYLWTQIEIISPAYEYTPENIAAVRKVCEILKTKFRTVTDESTGVHVHVSMGLDRFWDMRTLKHILMLFWAFEKQFDSIHPERRQQHVKSEKNFTMSMRAKSAMSDHYWTDHGIEITTINGIKQLQASADMKSMLTDVAGPTRYMSYNVRSLQMTLADGIGHGTTTIEFRQHEGTVDADSVTNWIVLLCGVIKWVETVDPDSFVELIKICKREWIKTGVKEDDEANERQFGPILAEGGFTVIDLLEHLKLQDQADFYRPRLHPVVVQPPRPLRDATAKAWQPKAEAEILWKHEQRHDRMTKEAFAKAEALKKVWLRMKAYKETCEPSEQSWEWDPDHPMWPEHWLNEGYGK